MKNIGGKVRALRTERQITLPDLADKARLSKGLLSKLENSTDANPSLDTLHRIAEALDVTLATFLETEQAQVRRIIPETPPDWQKGLVAYLREIGKEPDQDILNAMYVLRNRKAAKNADLESWKYLYNSIEKSFKT